MKRPSNHLAILFMDTKMRINRFLLFVFLTVSLLYSSNTWASDEGHWGHVNVGNLHFEFDTSTGEAILKDSQSKWYYPVEGYYEELNGDNDNYYEGKIDKDLEIPETINVKWETSEWNDGWKTIEHHATVRVTAISNIALLSWDPEFRTISIPSSVREIEDGAFRRCEFLEEVKLPNISRIEKRTFEDCKNLRAIKIPNSVTFIGESAFSGCSSLKSVTIPQNVTSIGREAFAFCYGLEHINFCNEQLEIGREAFRGCRFKTLCLPNGLTDIGLGAFNSCYDLEEIRFGNKLENLDSGAFKYCKKIRKIIIGDGKGRCQLKTINTSEFIKNSYCLSEIICYADNPPIGSEEWHSDTYRNATLIVPEESVENYKQSVLWGPFFVRDGKMNIEAYKGHDKSWKGKEAQGVTADGASQLMFYVDVKDPNYIVKKSEITLTPNIEMGVLPDVEGELVNNPDIVGKIEVKSVLENGKWGFIYTAPEDYPIINDSHKFTVTVDVKLTDLYNKEVRTTRCFDIVRPGVLLLHGLGADPGCFAGLKEDMLESGGWRSWQVYNGNYKSTNTAPFKTNATNGTVKNQLDELATLMFGLHGIVSSKYDIVGHSMGGILARKYAPSDDINRLITLDTPHLGSELADFTCNATSLAKNVVDLVKEFYGNKSLSGKLVSLTADFIEQKLVEQIEKEYGALEDLRTNSEAIKSLNPFAGAPVHAICSYIVHDQWNSTGDYWARYDEHDMPIDTWAGMMAFDRMLSDQHVYDDSGFQPHDWGEITLAAIFKGKNDGVVSYTSQIGGLGAGHFTEQSSPYEGLFGIKSFAHHVNTHHWEMTYSNIARLLQEPKTSDCFTRSFAPNPIVSAKKGIHSKKVPVYKEPTEGTTIKLKATLFAGTNILKAHLDKSDDIVYSMVFAFLDEKKMILGVDTLDYSFRIPETYVGDLTVCAMGRTSDFALVADTAVVHIDRGSELSYMSFDNSNPLLLKVGQCLEPSVLAGWSGGDEYYISPKLITDEPDLLRVEGSTVTGVESGRCLLVAEYLNMKDTIQVIIEQRDASDLPESVLSPVKDKNVRVLYEHGKLIINGNNHETGDIHITIMNVLGQTLNKSIVPSKMRYDGAVVIDVSYLPKQVYIAVIKEGNGAEVVKFAKE